MFGNYVTNLPSDVNMRSFVLVLGTTAIGPTVGGLTFDPGVKREYVKFDGLVAPVAGLDFILNYNSVISGKFLVFGTASIATFEAAASNVPTWGLAADGVDTGTLTPASGSQLFTFPGQYLQGSTQIRALGKRGKGTNTTGFVEIGFPAGFIESYKLVSKDNSVTELDTKLVARLHPTASAVEQCPYYIKLLDTIP